MNRVATCSNRRRTPRLAEYYSRPQRSPSPSPDEGYDSSGPPSLCDDSDYSSSCWSEASDPLGEPYHYYTESFDRAQSNAEANHIEEAVNQVADADEENEWSDSESEIGVGIEPDGVYSITDDFFTMDRGRDTFRSAWKAADIWTGLTARRELGTKKLAEWTKARSRKGIVSLGRFPEQSLICSYQGLEEHEFVARVNTELGLNIVRRSPRRVATVNAQVDSSSITQEYPTDPMKSFATGASSYLTNTLLCRVLKTLPVWCETLDASQSVRPGQAFNVLSRETCVSHNAEKDTITLRDALIPLSDDLTNILLSPPHAEKYRTSLVIRSRLNLAGLSSSAREHLLRFTYEPSTIL